MPNNKYEDRILKNKYNKLNIQLDNKLSMQKINKLKL